MLNANKNLTQKLWNDESHKKIIEKTIEMLEPHRNIEQVRLFLDLFAKNDFRKALFKGLKDADSLWRVWYSGVLFSYHFHDPDTGRNFLGGKKTAVTEGVRRFNDSMKLAAEILKNSSNPDKNSAKKLRKCGYGLGLTSHYLTDLIQPMHAANFANFFPTRNYKDYRHSDFEGNSDKHIKAGYLEKPSPPPFKEEDLNSREINDPKTFLESIAKNSKSIFTNKMKRSAEEKIIRDGNGRIIRIEKWKDKEVFDILDLTIKPLGLLSVAQFYILWVSMAQGKMGLQNV